MLQRVRADDVDIKGGGTSTTGAQKASELMRRYPDLSEPELQQLVSLFRDLSPVEQAMMMSDEEVAPQLEQFRREQRSIIRPPFRQYAPLVVIAIAGLATIVWAIFLAL